jgi:hypothetical protein
MNYGVSIRKQLRRNIVALISLAVAVTSLGYNTWRNEASEYNRNQRLISIEILRNLGDLQQVIFHNTWDMDTVNKGNPRTGWVHILTVKDLSAILDGNVSESAGSLMTAWETEWDSLAPDSSSYRDVMDALEAVRRDTHDLLRELD